GAVELAWWQGRPRRALAPFGPEPHLRARQLRAKPCNTHKPWPTRRMKRQRKTMAGDKQNLQDAFLNHVRKAKVPVTIFLINGVKLQGVITWFDNFCVLLRRDGQSQLVYKHAISTIMPG